MRLPQDIAEAALAIQQGGVVIFPTETVYGIGANAFEVSAVGRLFEIKQRPRFNPLVVHVADIGQLREVSESIPEWALPLIQNFWPGPLTLVLNKHSLIPDLVTAGLPTVAVRMPDHPIARELIRQSGCPIAAPSANPFMSLSPTSVAALQEEIKTKVDFVLDGGPCAIGLESTIVGLIDGKPTLLRPGGLAPEQIEPFTGSLHRPIEKFGGKSSILAPGMTERHYAPKTPLELWAQTPPAPTSPRCALLSFQSRPRVSEYAWQRSLSREGDLREAAAQFFGVLRELDEQNPERIYAELSPEKGLGIAINDRLRRGAHSS